MRKSSYYFAYSLEFYENKKEGERKMVQKKEVSEKSDYIFL